MLKDLVSGVLITVLMFNCSFLSADDKKGCVPGSAQPRFADMAEHRAEPFDIIKLTKDLNISKEQRKKLSAEKKAHNERMKVLQDSLRAKRAELIAELDKPVSDKSKLIAISSEIKNILAKMVDERLSSILRIKEILTPEQYKQFVEKKNKLFANRGK